MLNPTKELEGEETLPTFDGDTGLIGMHISRSGESVSMYSTVYTSLSNAFEDRSGASAELVEETPESIKYSGDRANCVGDGGDSDIEGDGYDLVDAFDKSMHLNLQQKELNQF